MAVDREFGNVIFKALCAVRRAWFWCGSVLEPFFRMDHLFEYIFMTLGYLSGSLLATWGNLGTPFGINSAPLGPFWEHVGHTLCFQKWDGASKVPKEAPTPK